MNLIRVPVDSGSVATKSRALQCLSCGSTAAAMFETLRAFDQHRAYAGVDPAVAAKLDAAMVHGPKTYAMCRCADCGLEFAYPAAAPSPAWYAALYGHLSLYPAARWEYGLVAQELGHRHVVIDYGCGSGEFLASVRERVAAAVGFDFSADAVSAAVARGIEAHRLDVDGVPQQLQRPRQADHVVAFHVLEHLPRPDALFRFATEVTSRSGQLWVAVPSDRRASRVYGEPDPLDGPPHHLTRWTAASLEAIGQQMGWRLVMHKYEPLSTRLAVWEATRRHAAFDRVRMPWRPAERVARRALAAALWATGAHRRAHVSGFSMMARFVRSDVP